MPSSNPTKKVLLMGKSGSGKTSMRSIIFANYMASDTMRLSPTLDVEHSHVRFLGTLVLNLWDCGGQDAFYENYFSRQRDHVFRNCELLIYVFDIESPELEKDLAHYEGCLEALEQNSPDARIFVLIHKMDTVEEANRDEVFQERKALIQSRTGDFPFRAFSTSIWDETLYKAWSMIVYSLIPNIKTLESHLDRFCAICNADEVVLFERATFLVISHATHRDNGDAHRYEKISNVCKQFKLACRSASAFQAMEVRNSRFTAYLDYFTTNTNIMVVTSPENICTATTQLNIRVARKHFEQLIKESSDQEEEETEEAASAPAQ